METLRRGPLVHRISHLSSVVTILSSVALPKMLSIMGALLVHRAIQASPIPIIIGGLVPGPMDPSFTDPIIAQLQCDCPETRSLTEIIWSCVATLFACTWVSVHPNIPAEEDGYWTVSWRRLRTMAFNLLAPDFIMFWAYRQWAAAKVTRDKFRARGWTMTHAFFIEMGGFMLYEDGKPLGVLTSAKFERLLEEDAVDFPTITVKEIEDRSKADAIAKAVVVVQTLWFLIQSIARLSLKLTLTHLEYFTLMFTVFNCIFYFLWWYKPLNVGLTFPVHLKPREKPASSSCSDDVETIYWSIDDQDILEVPREPEASINNASISDITKVDKPASPGPNFRLRDWVSAHAIIKRFVEQPRIIDPETEPKVEKHGIHKHLARAESVFQILTLGATRVADGAPRVSTYYASTLPLHGFSAMGMLALFVLFIYAPYFLAPLVLNLPEIGTTAIGVWIIAGFCGFGWGFIIISFHLVVPHLTGLSAQQLWDHPDSPQMTKWFSHFLTLCYFFSKGCLIFVAFYTLRMLPEDAMRDVDWSSFIPHVS